MQTLVSSLAAGLLFVHTMFGCCWHHAHGCEHGRAVARNEPAKCCHHHQHTSDSKQHEQPCEGKAECVGDCTYVAPQKVTVEAPQWNTIDHLAVLPALADREIEAAATWEAVSSLPDGAPPLRTHLLHQVLLN